jgi:hypothetical protein
MECKKNKMTLQLLTVFMLAYFISCNDGDFLQEYKNYQEFCKIDNPRLTGWFPVALIKSDAYNIKNVSYLKTKCVFGVIHYKNEEPYNLIFNKEKHIDKTHNKIFQSQIKSVKNIIPEWFPKVEYWNKKRNGIILFDNCYAYKDSIRKQIYYFHPEEGSTFINGKIYPGIRDTIR